MPIQPIVRTPSAQPFPLLIKQLLISPMARASKNEIVYRGTRFRYPTLIERVHRLASGLSRLGVQPGETVAVMDWCSNRYLECFFAIPSIGCVLQTINIRLSPDQILYTLNHAAAQTVIVHADFLPLLEGLLPKLTQAKRFVLIDEAGAKPKSAVAFATEFEALVASGDPAFELPDFDENARATTFYTSGTTGLPKGVYYSHRQIVLHTLGIASTLGCSPVQGRFHSEDVYMPITPMFHVHAWGMPFTATLLGVKQIYPGRYQYDQILDTIRDENVTYSHCVPTILHTLLTHPKAKDMDFSRWKVLCGGSAVSKGLMKLALERGIDLFTGYGMSETGPLQVINHLHSADLAKPIDEQVRLRTRTGQPALLCELAALDEKNKPLPHDGESTGEIGFRSPWLTQGYFQEPQKSEELWRGGWLHSGDIGYFSEDGTLQIADRVKDVIKTGGEWLSSLELEDIISQHPAVAEVAVIAVKDERWGERPLALVVPKPGQSVDAASIQAHVRPYAERGAICKYGIPETVLFVEALDKTSVGKLDKKVLRAKYQDAGGREKNAA